MYQQFIVLEKHKDSFVNPNNESEVGMLCLTAGSMPEFIRQNRTNKEMINLLQVIPEEINKDRILSENEYRTNVISYAETVNSHIKRIQQYLDVKIPLHLQYALTDIIRFSYIKYFPVGTKVQIVCKFNKDIKNDQEHIYTSDETTSDFHIIEQAAKLTYTQNKNGDARIPFKYI